ncbi:MAG: hypothetical protein ACXAD7_28525 [Candidatus Kariarchaeaceae archaeon]|jgi:ABC-type transport system involved in cytochrome c biogenesis permease subunit
MADEVLAISENQNDFLLISFIAFIVIWLVLGRLTRSGMVNRFMLNLFLISWITIFAITFIEKNYTDANSNTAIYVLVSIVAISSFLFSFMFRSRSSKPLKQMINQTDMMADGDLVTDLLVDLKGTGETATLLNSNRRRKLLVLSKPLRKELQSKFVD